MKIDQITSDLKLQLINLRNQINVILDSWEDDKKVNTEPQFELSHIHYLIKQNPSMSPKELFRRVRNVTNLCRKPHQDNNA